MPSWWLPSQKAWLAEARGLTLLLPTDETLVVYSKEVGSCRVTNRAAKSQSSQNGEFIPSLVPKSSLARF